MISRGSIDSKDVIKGVVKDVKGYDFAFLFVKKASLSASSSALRKALL